MLIKIAKEVSDKSKKNNLVTVGKRWLMERRKPLTIERNQWQIDDEENIKNKFSCIGSYNDGNIILQFQNRGKNKK